MTTPEWINLEDAMPEENQLVYIKGKFPFETDARFMKNLDGYSFIRYSKTTKHLVYDFYGVTHWKPYDNI